MKLTYIFNSLELVVFSTFKTRHMKIQALLEPFFETIFEPALMHELETASQLIHVPKDSEIMDVGSEIKGIPVIVEGTIKIMREDENGNEILLYYVEAGDTCAMTLNCCVNKMKSSVRAIVEEDSKIVLFPLEKMDEWLIKYESWRRFILGSYQARFNEMLSAFDMLAFKKLDERLWGYLVDKVKITGSLELPITHHTVAEELNTSRVVISRLLKQLEQQNKLKLHRNKIELFEY